MQQGFQGNTKFVPNFNSQFSMEASGHYRERRSQVRLVTSAKALPPKAPFFAIIATNVSIGNYQLICAKNLAIIPGSTFRCLVRLGIGTRVTNACTSIHKEPVASHNSSVCAEQPFQFPASSLFLDKKCGNLDVLHFGDVQYSMVPPSHSQVPRLCPDTPCHLRLFLIGRSRTTGSSYFRNG